jgi:N-acylglucosamine 2-epimerase
MSRPSSSVHGPAGVAALRDVYRRALLDDVMPFWLRHGRDDRHGGFSNVLDDAGNALGFDKFLWSQGRALWTLSAMHRRVQSDGPWLDFATHVYRYLATHGRDDRGHWVYRLDADGRVLEGDTSIAVDAFVMNGLGEYAAASGDREALDLALATQASVAARLARPGSYGFAPYGIPEGMKNLGVAMLYSLFFFELGEVADRDDIRREGLRFVDEILDEFHVREHDALLEFVSLDGRFVDSPAGRTCVPGHGIEALWFAISILERSGGSPRIADAVRLIRRHLEIAWDPEHGGLSLAVDIAGREPVFWKRHDCKPWWVQVEALVATAYAHAHSGEPWCLEWHDRIREWAFARYPVATGEWRQWLDREGRPTTSAALPVKDPFHLPRALMALIDVLGR